MSTTASGGVVRVQRPLDFYDGMADEFVLGSSGDDTLYGGKGNDLLVGGAGSDTWLVEQPSSQLLNVTVDAVSGLRTFHLSRGQVTLDGVEFIQFTDLRVAADDPLLLQRVQVRNTPDGINVVGTDLPVSLMGGKGSDTLQGNGGDDTVYGGFSGVDTAVYRGPQSDYVLGNDALTGFVTISDRVPGRDGTDSLVGIDRLRFADGEVALERNALANGTPGDDQLNRKGGPTEFYGEGGDDDLNGSPQDVAVYRGLRSEYVIERSPLTALPTVRDLVAGRDGTDVVHAMGSLRFADATVPYVLPPLNRQLTGSERDETLFGGDGEQVLVGLGNDDFLNGGADQDTAVFRGPRSDYTIAFQPYSEWAQVVDGVAGRDGRDNLHGIEWLRFSDMTVALDLNRTVTGTPAADGLLGGDGDQRFVGQGGNDTLDGGRGTDTFVFSGARSEYRPLFELGYLARVQDLVSGRDGRNTLIDIEWLQFRDATVSFNDYFAPAMQAWTEQALADPRQWVGRPSSASDSWDYEAVMALAARETSETSDADMPLSGVVHPGFIGLTAQP